MGEIVRFFPRAEHTCNLNLDAYITFNKSHLPRAIGPWESDIWDISTTEKRRKAKNGKRLYFRSWANSKKNASQKLGETLSPPFKEFAKGYLAEVIRERGTTELGRTLKSVQCLAAATEALRESPNITKVDHEVADYAAQLIAERNAFTSRWTYGRELERLITRIKEAGLSEWRGDWKQPFKYQKPARNDEVNKKAQASHMDRLPDVRAVLALAEIHHQSNADNDKLPTSFAALAMVAPERASEILTMPVDCKTSMESDGSTVFGIRWRPLKGGQAKTNWAINSEFEQVAKGAIDYLIQRGEKARTAARWYEKNPNKLYLPPSFEHLRDETGITLWEATQIIGRSTVPKACHKTLRFGFTEPVGQLQGSEMDGRHGEKEGNKRRPGYIKLYALDELEKFVLAKLPRNFPIIDEGADLSFSDALWCLPKNILRPGADTLEYLPDAISLHQINHQLGANPEGLTVFSRHNKLDDNKKPWEITSHQFRHLLNTLAQSKYVSQELIAFWSGRKRVEQNQWYDHVPQEAYIEAYLKLQSGAPDVEITGPLSDKAESTAKTHGISRRDALRYELGSTHMTRYGICRHDYSLTPCPKDKNCIDCGEQVFIKGRVEQTKEAEEQIELLEKGVAEAKEAVAAGRFGAQRWLDLNEPKLKRWELALNLLTDPKAPDGTLITLPPPEESQCKAGIAHAIRSKTEKDNQDEQLVRMMLE